jgi:hypothetical protein
MPASSKALWYTGAAWRISGVKPAEARRNSMSLFADILVLILYDGIGISVICSGVAAFVTSYWLVQRMPDNKFLIGFVGPGMLLVLWSIVFTVLMSNLELIRKHPGSLAYPGYTILAFVLYGFMISLPAWVMGTFLGYLHHQTRNSPTP